MYLANLSVIDQNILGTSDSLDNQDNADTPIRYPTRYPTSVRIPLISYAPLPTAAPLPTSVAYSAPNPTSAPDCSGTPTAYNSQAYVSSASTQVNTPVTIEVQLLDCHNTIAPVDDKLTITLLNSDGTARINGKNSPVYIQAQNGKAAFTVNSQINITDTFVVTDTTRQFNVTDTKNRNPSVTFINNSSGNPKCTTAPGVPNTWYSDVIPASPQSSPVGTAVTFDVIIRDCNKNTVSSNESLNITLASGSSSTTVNGNGLPYSLTAAAGQAKLKVNSQNAGSVTIVIRDTTSSFTITDPNNHNPSVNFTSSSSASVTPVPTSAQANSTPTPSKTPSQTPPTPTTQSQPTTTTNPMPTANTTLHPVPTQ